MLYMVNFLLPNTKTLTKHIVVMLHVKSSNFLQILKHIYCQDLSVDPTIGSITMQGGIWSQNWYSAGPNKVCSGWQKKKKNKHA